MNNHFSIGKLLKIVTLALLSFVFIVLAALVFVSVAYKKTLVEYLRAYLDEHLLTELSMEDIRFRVLKGFPNATIEITNAEILSGKDFSSEAFMNAYADTLLRAKSIALQFNLLKLLSKEYEVKKIAISGANINILFDNHNRNNLKIWKPDEGSGKKYVFNLRNIEIASSAFRIQSLHQAFELSGRGQRVHFRGSLNEGVLAGDIKGSVMIKHFIIKDNLLSRNANVNLSMHMRYGEKKLAISEGKLQINKAMVTLQGEYISDKVNTIDMQVKVAKFGLEEVMSLLPEGNRFNTGGYAFNGTGRMNLLVKGPASDINRLLIRADFEMKDGIARNVKTRESLHSISLKGSASGTNATNFKATIDTLSARLGKGYINGSFTLSNLRKLTFVSRLVCNTDLKAMKAFASIDTIEMLEGEVKADFTARGSLKRITDSSALALDFLQSGTFYFENAGIKFKGLPMTFDKIHGRAGWNNTVTIDSLSLRMNETTMTLSGTVANLTNYLLRRGILKLSLNLNTDNLDITKYLNQPTSLRSSSGYKSMSVFPENIWLRAKVRAGTLVGGKFKAGNVSLNMSARKDSVYLNEVSMRFPDGSIAGEGLITMDKDHQVTLYCNSRPQKINIRELFFAFNNFSQKFILDKNMKGQLEGAMNFQAKWDSTLKLIPSSMKVTGEFEITNGELLDFEPMLKLSRYISVEELRHIRFSTLHNTINISDRVVSIPEMAISSSAFNISISGQHSFDNQFDYRMNVLLSEVLSKKARKRKKEIDEFLIEESPDDQTTIPLIVAGTPSDFDVKLDRKKAFRLTGNRLKNKETPDKPVKDNFEVQWEEPAGDKPGKEPDQQPEGNKDIEVIWEE